MLQTTQISIGRTGECQAPAWHQRLAQALRWFAGWPIRVAEARRIAAQLNGMSEYELADIGLTRQDVSDVSALPLDQDPGGMLNSRVNARYRYRR